MTPTEERALVARVLEGSRQAARQLYDAHVARVHRLVFRIVRDDQLAEEFTQDAFVKVFGALKSFRGEAKLSTWIHRVAVTEALSGLRRLKRRAGREFDLDDAVGIAAPDRRIEPDLAERLHRAIDALPDVFRIPLVLHDLEGFTHSEIAQLTGSPEGTCKTRLMNARARLREALAAYAQ
ncbi:MAG: sigma-70 family RNA polymerase sigma factor [Gemmatimonadales bacterium]